MRHVVFVRTTEKDGYFVVIDDVKKDDKPREYSHTFHYDPRDVDTVLAEGNSIVLHAKKAKLMIQATHPMSGFTARKLEKYEDTYVKLTCKEKMARLVMMTVLYPVRKKHEPVSIVPQENETSIAVNVNGVVIEYDKTSKTVSVSGDLSEIKARNAKPLP